MKQLISQNVVINIFYCVSAVKGKMNLNLKKKNDFNKTSSIIQQIALYELL